MDLHNHVVWVSENEVKDNPQDKASEIAKLNAQLRASQQQPVMEQLGHDYFQQGSKNAGTYLRKSDFAVIEKALEEGKDNLDEYEEDYEDRPEAKSYIESTLRRALDEAKTRTNDFKLPEGAKLVPMISPYERDTYRIIGPAGAGKSTLASTLLSDYRRVFPENMIYILSPIKPGPDKNKHEDPSFAKFIEDPKAQFINTRDPQQVASFVEKVRNGIANQMEDCAMVLDDVDNVENKQLAEAIRCLRASLLQTGRHGGCYIWDLSHVYRGGEKTKGANLECTNIGVFPKHGETYFLGGYLREYCGFTKRELHRLMKEASRWALISKKVPKFVLHEYGGYFRRYEDPDEEKKAKKPVRVQYKRVVAPKPKGPKRRRIQAREEEEEDGQTGEGSDGDEHG